MQATTHPSAAKLAHLEKREGSTAMPVGSVPQHIETRAHASTAPPPNFIPLHLETRSHVDTATAAYHLMRRPQTLRGHACHEDGPIRPLRINGRLAWDVRAIKAVLGVA